MLFEACCDGSEVLDFAEKAFDEVAVAIEELAEGRDVFPVRHWLHVCPGAAFRERAAQVVAVVGAVGQQDLAFADVVQHIGGAAPVMSLAFGQLQPDRQAVGIDEGMDLRRQSAPRAPKHRA